MSENNYPNTRPPYTPDQLRGNATVEASTGTVYSINFDKVECDCKHGAAYRWQKTKWVPNGYCNHKLKAISSLIEAGDETLREFYQTSLGKRINAFVCVSAFHKEMRRGDEDKALYWATCLLPHRGRHGVIGYMRNILFEETRDLGLVQYILRLSAHGKGVTERDMQNAVRRFCRAPKKWELPWRRDVFLDEMRGYRMLAKDYGYEIAKGKDIIAHGATDKLKGMLQQGFADANRPLLQAGLKGWFKSKSADHDVMKIEMFNHLTEYVNGERVNHFEYDAAHCNRLHGIILRRIEQHGSPGYHELNALADALSEPREGDQLATLPTLAHKRIVNSPRIYTLPLGDFRAPPLYAHDNHTWAGKALMKSYGAAQLQPSAVQTNLDFRLCGAYMGVAWRTLAFDQHATIDVPWGKVSWASPNWLWGHLDKMWY